MRRRYARSRRGERAMVVESAQRGANVSVISALRTDGVQAPMMLPGAFDAAAAATYVRECLAPLLTEGDIIVWDNVKFHKHPEVLAEIEAAKATVVSLPAYSPDLNPIEECISKIKALVRGFRPKTMAELGKALKRALGAITETDAEHWIRHAGYVLT